VRRCPTCRADAPASRPLWPPLCGFMRSGVRHCRCSSSPARISRRRRTCPGQAVVPRPSPAGWVS
jgi:hypothetical protein